MPETSNNPDKKVLTFEEKVEYIEKLMENIAKFSIAQFITEDEEGTNKESVLKHRKQFELNSAIFNQIELNPMNIFTRQKKLVQANKELKKNLEIAVDAIGDMSLFYMKLCFVVKYLVRFQMLHNNKQKIEAIGKFNKCDTYNNLLKVYEEVMGTKPNDVDFIL